MKRRRGRGKRVKPGARKEARDRIEGREARRENAENPRAKIK